MEEYHQSEIADQAYAKRLVLRFGILNLKIPISYAFTLLFFCGSFFNFSCEREYLGNVTGMDLVTGSYLHRNDKKESEYYCPSNTWAQIAFVCAIVGLVVGITKLKFKKIIVTLVGIIGVVSLYYLNIDIPIRALKLSSFYDINSEEANIVTGTQSSYYMCMFSMICSALFSFFSSKTSKMGGQPDRIST
ncbi:hypothetical protein [Pedobacter steynii]